jgi:5'-3' exonuclease
LANHTKTFKFPHYGRTIPSSAFQQLLCILPPKSAHLLPEQLAKLLTDEMSPIKKYCPDNFEIDLGGKRKEFEGIVLVPMIDVELVRDCYLENLGKIDSRELKRNLVRKSIVYEYIPGLHGSFISYYGNIEKCSVRTMFIDI